MASQYNILHVEDDKEYHNLFRIQMSRMNKKEDGPGLFFTNVASVEDALSSFKENEYDIIVSDYQILKGNGLDFLKEVRKIDLYTPVIFLTAQGDEQVARDVFINGANDYFSKEIGLVSYEKIYNAIRFQINLFETRRRERDTKKKLYFNEILLLNLFESMLDVLFYQDLEGKYLIVNNAFKKLVGKEKNEIIGKSANQIFDDITSRVLEESNEVSNSDEKIVLTEDRVEIGGESYFFETLKIPIHDDDGELTGSMGIGRNITDRKKVELSVKTSKKYYRSILRTLPHCGILIFNKGLKIKLLGGEGIISAFGNKVNKNNFWNSLDKQNKEKIKNAFMMAINGRAQLLRFEQGIGTYEMHIVPMAFGRNMDSFGMATIFDITQSEKVRDDLRSQRKELSDFSRTLSYNLKNKLITLNAYTQLIIDDDDNYEVHCKNLLKTSKKINEYISGQLLLAEAGLRKSDAKPVDLDYIIDKVERNYLIEVERESLPIVIADPKKMEELFNNLVSNSLNHGKTDHISISASMDGANHTIVYKDHGLGIPNDILDKVFDLGFSTNGNGFGLSIVKRIVELYNGEILVSSAEGKGTVFEITLPRVSKPL